MTRLIHDIVKKKYHVPHTEKVEEVVDAFSMTAKTVLWFFVILFIASGLYLLYKVNTAYLVEVPASGGELVEGVIGLPRFINPVLSVTDAGEDLTTLVYSGLYKETPEGELAPDLAESYTVSEDGKVYTFILKDNIYFHDGEQVTVDDVEFTVQKAQDPELKSPQRARWQGVTVEKIDTRTIQFSLKQPLATFLESTTMGILPKHIWKDVSGDEFTFSNYNIHAIGSGPYKIAKIKNNTGGIPTYYNLEAFNKYAGGKPLIEHITMRFYPNETKLLEAYEKGEVDSINSISPEHAKYLEGKGVRIERATLPRIFGVFFNQNNNSLFLNKEVKQALDLAVNRNQIINDVLMGYGKAIQSPVPYTIFEPDIQIDSVSTSTPEQQAIVLLEKNGWTLNAAGVREKKTKNASIPLTFSLSTSDAPELKAIALALSDAWKKIGATVDVKIYDIGDLNQSVIRPRKYDALLFGQIINSDLDLFAFWHSSQRNDPGLNIAMYTNATVDKLLEDARVLSNKNERMEKYKKIEEEIKKDVPALFVYSPDFLYVVPKNIKGYLLGNIRDPKERFLSIEKRYIETDNVWKVFIN